MSLRFHFLLSIICIVIINKSIETYLNFKKMKYTKLKKKPGFVLLIWNMLFKIGWNIFFVTSVMCFCLMWPVCLCLYYLHVLWNKWYVFQNQSYTQTEESAIYNHLHEKTENTEDTESPYDHAQYQKNQPDTILDSDYMHINKVS